MYNKNIYDDIDLKKIDKINSFCEDYKTFLSKAKTERLSVNEIEKVAIQHGFKNITLYSNLKAGDKVYFLNKNKNIVLYRLGEKSLLDGIKILGSHIDSPRMDLKQNPLYESKEFALLDTHYYGGIKKYQYVTIPLALHGVVCKKDGSCIEISIGEDENDPVFVISDLLIHLSSEQMQKTANTVIDGEKLDIIIGSIPFDNEEKDRVKLNILKLLKEKYTITEEDFISTEIEVVPAGKARDCGLDRSMIASYGHDDRVCAYTSLRAIIDIKQCTNTACALFVDKEEVGSFGSTGAQSMFFENSIIELLHKFNQDSLYNFRICLQNSIMLSCDVNAALDPLYSNVSDENNCARFNYGIVVEKYTGSKGKCGGNDANPEYIAKLRKIMDANNIYYQTGQICAVDQGGGGTIAHISAKYNLDVIDAGIPVLNMHSPMEIVSKADVYEAYLAYKAFFNNALH